MTEFAGSVSYENKYELKNWQLYLFITVLYLIITLVNDKFVLTKGVISLLLADKIESNRIDDYYELLKRFSVYTYIALPIIVFIKMLFIALLIQTPLLLKGIEINFKETFRIAAFANIPYLLLGFIKLIILFFTPQSHYSNELLNNIPGSLTNFLSRDSYTPVAFNFLNSINIYEFIWIFVIAYGLMKHKKLNKIDSFIFAFGLWIGITLFQSALIFYFNKA